MSERKKDDEYRPTDISIKASLEAKWDAQNESERLNQDRKSQGLEPIVSKWSFYQRLAELVKSKLGCEDQEEEGKKTVKK